MKIRLYYNDVSRVYLVKVIMALTGFGLRDSYIAVDNTLKNGYIDIEIHQDKLSEVTEEISKYGLKYEIVRNLKIKRLCKQ